MREHTQSALRPLALAVALAVAGIGACSGQTSANAQTPPAAVANAPTATPPPQLVPGLPDFTALVAQVGPAVVSVQAEVGGAPRAERTRQQQPGQRSSPNGQRIEGEDGGDEGMEGVPEIFRRFFGPGMEPGQPSERPRGTSLGTGFIISSDGYVLTNRHVIDGADSVRIRLADRRELTARIVGSDEQSDIALLKVDAKDLPTVRIGQSSGLKPGQWVVAIGSPFGFDHSVTAGIVSAVGRANPYSDQRYVPFIQTDVAINRGNSGGPLLDTRGQVVGINSQIFSNSGGYMGVSFAIPIDTAMNAVNQLKATGRVVRGQLGIQIQPISRDAARALGLGDNPAGALVAGVEPDSAAARAGVQRQDVVRSVNGQPVYDASDLPPIIGAMAPGARVSLEVVREGKPMTLTATLGALGGETAAAGDRDAPSNRSAPAAAPGNRFGILSRELDTAQRSRLGLQPGEGVLVAGVEGRSARAAGLRPGDVILAVGRTDVGSPRALDEQLRNASSAKPVMLLVQRNGASQYLAVDQEQG
ncbi:Do family serine endopeptidase [Thermomonas sp.]|uniref:Do family serine endopeptidase n=1 Tax=Thermomonas sp. TaxID=1971895 RepID=UPI002617231A|nr:Do family serine endopeptidase [Thermomonas sp.]MCO5054401.1 Do family serine endopeptidase [Thermomonas sp.]